MPAGENKCATCGQFAGRGHRCPTITPAAVAETPLTVSVPETGRDEVNERVDAARTEMAQREYQQAVIARDVAGIVGENRDGYLLNPPEGSMGWEDFGDQWNQEWSEFAPELLDRDGLDERYADGVSTQLTIARNTVQEHMYESYGVTVSNEDAVAFTKSLAEEVGAEAVAHPRGGLAADPRFADRLESFARERVIAPETRPWAGGSRVPSPARPISVVSREQRLALTERMWEAEATGKPGDFSDEEVATLRAITLPTARESSLLMHQANGSIRRLRERYEQADTEEEKRSLQLEADLEGVKRHHAWRDLVATSEGAAMEQEISGEQAREEIAEARLERLAAVQRFERVTGVTVNPEWFSGQEAQPPNLPYAKGCECRQFQWTGRCEHTDIDLARRKYMETAVAAVFEESGLGKAMSKAGLTGMKKKPGFFRRIFGG